MRQHKSMISANVWNEGEGESVLSQKQYDTGRLGKNFCPSLFLKIETEGSVTTQAGSLFPKRLTHLLTHLVRQHTLGVECKGVLPIEL